MSSSMGGMNKRRSAAEIMGRRTGVRQRSHRGMDRRPSESVIMARRTGVRQRS